MSTPHCARLFFAAVLALFAPELLAQAEGGQAHPEIGQAAQNRLEVQAAEHVDQVRQVTSMLPRVDVTHVAFGVGCPNPADPTGSADSTCAIRKAIDFAQANPVRGSGYPVLYFPHGRYRVAGTGYTAALTINVGISMVGDGAQSTTILNASPSAGTLAYNKAGECAGKPGPCFIKIEGITFAGEGHRSMGGLIEINSTDTGLMDDVVLAETGGIALNLQGSSERWNFSRMEINHARWPVLTEGDTNENYFERVNVINPGSDESSFCFSVNCPGGHLALTGTWFPDPHSAVYLDGDNVHWVNSSVKSTALMGGVHLAAVTSSIAHSYVEGDAWGGQPRTNHAVEIGGKLELGHTTAQISATDLLIPVDDAGWQPLYENDPALVTLNGAHAYTPAFTLFPADYLYGSTQPSAAVPGITRGTLESVRVASFAGDGRAHLVSRGQDGTRAIAWPAGSVIEQIPANAYGMARIESNHFNSVSDEPKSTYASGCDDTAQLTQWTSSPSRLCAEIIAGLVPDGFGVPIPTREHGVPPFELEIADNSIFTGGSEQNGEGWIKIAGNANLTLDEGTTSLRSFASADTALNTYINGNTRVEIVQWDGTSAMGVVHDLSANVLFSPQEHYYSADLTLNRSVSHQYLGEQCWYGIVPEARQPTSRFCVRPSGPSQETLVNGHWVPAGKP